MYIGQKQKVQDNQNVQYLQINDCLNIACMKRPVLVSYRNSVSLSKRKT